MAAVVSQCGTTLNYCLRQLLLVLNAESGSCGQPESLSGFLTSDATIGLT